MTLQASEAAKSPPRLEVTTCWDFPFQRIEGIPAGDASFNGCTPALAVWNVISRYTRPGDLVVDPMAGSGTTLDVARMSGRRVLAFDLHPTRPEIIRNDARHLPLEDNSVNLFFVDSPYSDNIRYSDDPRCLGRVPASSEAFYEGLVQVAHECRRALRPSGVLAWVISDEYRQHKFTPVGFRFFARLSDLFEPLDVICLLRRNDRSLTPIWEHRALKRNFFLRGFKYLFLLRKPLAVRT